MQIKRFRAETVDDALRDVRRELGRDALILSTRELRTGFARLGHSAKTVVEVVAAIDRDARREAEPLPASASGWVEDSFSNPLLAPLEHELRSLRDCLENPRPDREIAQLRDEVAALRDAMRALREPASASTQDGDAARRLRHRGFAPSLCAQLLEEAALDGAAPDSTDLRALRRVLARRLDAVLPPPTPSGATPIEVFVGAPGVGKTTSLAKIAARDQADCAMLSADGERAGGTEALRQLSDETGVPFSTVWSPDQALSRASRLGRARLLIDTPGSSRSDRRGRAELVRLREQVGRRVTVHWVASATTREDDLRDELRRFDALRPDTLILTKVDETTSLAHVADFLLDPATPPLCWLGTSAHVPDGLAVPDPARLSRRMLGGTL